MAALKNQRHELFAQSLAKGKTADEAYQEAGYKPNRGNAATLKANQSISDRVAELLERGAKKVSIDHAWVLAKLVENVERAMQVQVDIGDDGQIVFEYEGAVANKALELIGKHVRFFPADKLEHSGPDGGPIETSYDLKKLDVSELRQVRALVEKAKG